VSEPQPHQRPLRFLVVHPKGSDAPTHALRARQALEPFARGAPFTVVTAHEDWEANFSRAGGWEPWIRSVTVDREYATGRPRYDGFVAIGERHGNASARILTLALGRGAPVTWLDERGLLRKVETIEHVGDRQWSVDPPRLTDLL
jgi:hypothetical protein